MKANSAQGFTLIEALIAITIISLLSGIGMSNYNRFNRKQQLRQSALNFVSLLRRLQNDVLAGANAYNPRGGNPAANCSAKEDFIGYKISRGGRDNEYTVAVVCSEQGLPVNYKTKIARGKLGQHTQFASNFTEFEFTGPYGRTDRSDALKIEIVHVLSPALGTAEIVITAGGDISCQIVTGSVRVGCE